MTTDNGLPPQPTSPGFFRRLAAIGYDCLLVFALLFAAALIPAWLSGSLTPISASDSTVVYDVKPAMQGWLFQLYLIFVVFAFYCWFWRKSGQTLGMQAWRIRLQSNTDSTPTYKQCFIRFFGACISALCVGAGYWWMLIDKDKLSWHDRWSKTHLELLPKRKK